MKLYGIALIMLASLWLSAQSVSVRRQHAETLGQFCLLLERLAGEIRIDAKPMPELLQSLVSRSGDSAEKFLDYLCTSLEKLGECSFSKLWEDALLVIPELHPDEIRELEKLGLVLGRYDSQTQEGAIQECAQLLKAEEQRLRCELPQYRRLALGLGLSAAGLIGILLI